MKLPKSITIEQKGKADKCNKVVRYVVGMG